MESVVRIANETLKIETGTDLVAIFALIISIIALVWQYSARKKEIKLQRWNALYPHRLKFYTDFFDKLHKLEKYDADRHRTADSQIQEELNNFCRIFHRFSQEVIILFPKTIQQDVISVYDAIQDIITNPVSHSMPSALPRKTMPYLDFQELQKRIKQLNLENTLKNNILNYLNLEGQENE